MAGGTNKAEVQETEAKSYYSQSRSEMLQFLPSLKKAKLIDIGCGAGTFLQEIREVKADWELWGLELNKDAAKKAEQHAQQVIQGPIDESLAAIPDGAFDCIIFNDVLEHLVDPEYTLIQIKQKLKKDGVVISSIPNVRYIKNLYNLVVKRDWQYEDNGILDRTHLRFYTKKSIKNMFAKIDYEIVEIKGVNPTRIPAFSLFEMLSFGNLSDTRFMNYAVVVKAL